MLDAGTDVTNYFKPTYDVFGRTSGWANPEGLAFVGSRLFVAGSLPSYFGPRGIWEIDPYTAKALSFVSTPGEPRGVASDGAGLYVTVFSGNTSSIYYCYTFSYLSSKLMDFVYEDIQGLAFGRGYLFASSRSALYRIGISSPMVVGGSRLPWDDVTGLDFVDGPAPFLLATVSSENAVFKLGLDRRLDWDGTYSVFQLLGAGRHKAVALRP
jgi:hypothetical protein